MKPDHSPRILAILLAALVALTPFSVDTYLPAMPAMMVYFGTDMGMVEMTVGSFFVGFSMGQLVGGPLSDHYGRRRVGGVGVVIFFMATILIIFSSTIEMVILGRFIQAFGGGFVTVIAPSIVRDRFQGREAAKMFALISIVMMLAPLIAPAVGAIFLKFSDWRMIFVFLGGYALTSFIIIFFYLPERPNVIREKLNFKKVKRGYLSVLSNRSAVGFMITQTFSAGVMFLFITGAAFAYITYLGMSTDVFPLLFGANIITMMLFNRLNPFLLNLFTPDKLIGIGIAVQFLALVAFMIGQFIDPKNIYMVVPMMMIAIGSSAIITPNSFACFLENFKDNSGSATALIGTCQFLMGAVLGICLGLLHSDTIFPMASLMLMSSTISLTSYYFLTRR
ncbi:MAG: multidrug effflux MFS transporter [Emcibacter sp.]|nr:multidrug effflux MFS transporter [Emcibacter sp.]